MFCLDFFFEGRNLGCYRPSPLIWNLIPRFKMLMGYTGFQILIKHPYSWQLHCRQSTVLESSRYCWVGRGGVHTNFGPLTTWLYPSKFFYSALLFGVERVTLLTGGGQQLLLHFWTTSVGSAGIHFVGHWRASLLFLFLGIVQTVADKSCTDGDSFLSYWVRLFLSAGLKTSYYLVG